MSCIVPGGKWRTCALVRIVVGEVKSCLDSALMINHWVARSWPTRVSPPPLIISWSAPTIGADHSPRSWLLSHILSAFVLSCDVCVHFLPGDVVVGLVNHGLGVIAYFVSQLSCVRFACPMIMSTCCLSFVALLSLSLCVIRHAFVSSSGGPNPQWWRASWRVESCSLVIC